MDEEVAVGSYFEARPRSKDLPNRGTLFESRPEAVASHWKQFFLASISLFLLPSATYLLAFLFLGLPLGISSRASAEDAVYVFLFLSGSTGLFLLFLGGTMFPHFFRFHQVIPLIVGRRRHRSHFSFMSPRRMSKVCGKQVEPWFSVFIMGLFSRSLSVAVTKATTVLEIFQQLQALGAVPSDSHDQFYAIANGQRILAWTDTMQSLNLGPGSHIFFRARLLGGGRRRLPSSSPSPSGSGPAKKRKTEAVASEDEDTPIVPKPRTKPKAPARLVGGRKSHSSRGQRDDEPTGPTSTPPPTLQELPETPQRKRKSSRPKKVPKFSPRTARSVAFALGPHLRLGPAEDSDSGSSSEDSDRPKQRKRKPRALNKIKHSKKAGWIRVGSSHTSEIYQTFEQWRNDYTPHEYESAEDLVTVNHLGHPVDRPKDIRARPFIVQWITPNRDAPEAFLDDPRPIFRAEYRCKGNCSDVTPSDREFDTQSETEPKNQTNSGPKKYQKRTCPQNVVLHVEIYSNDLSKAVIFQRGTHWEAAEEYLGFSEHIRQCIMEYASLANMTAGRIKRRLLHAYKDKNTPLFRRPSATQVENIVTNIRRAERLESDPLKSIGVFAELHPDKIFGFCPVDMSTDPPSKFAAGIKSVHALQSLLLWAFTNGIGLDSCWRHKNENRAPVTFITTIDQNHRMLPGPVYLSANVTAETLEVFLQDVKELVEQMALDLLAGDVEVHPSHDRFKDQLMECAERVRANDWNWIPVFVMIDKSGAELKAISAVWPTTEVRLCQFHVIQAILRWDRDHDGSTSRPKLSRGAKDKLLHAVRELQRCRSDDEWDAATRTFKTRVASFADARTTTVIMEYFERNWFIPLWRDSWTDIGLPPGRNRDTISTNNWTERAFKTFDQIFLENRANKSAYRLVMIIANEWFSYYENWQLDAKKVDRTAFKIAERGHRLWNSGGAIIEMPLDHKGRRNWRVGNIRAIV